MKEKKRKYLEFNVQHRILSRNTINKYLIDRWANIYLTSSQKKKKKNNRKFIVAL